MFKLLLKILLDEKGSTLAITRKTSGTVITAAGFNTNYDEIEAVVNALTSTNYAADSVGRAALNSDVVNSNNGLKQESNGSLSVDPSDTNPSLEISDGGLRAKVAELINRTSSGLTWGRTSDLLSSGSTSTPSGFTDVSSTYNNKFMRVSTGTPFTTGGADTHTHGAGSYANPSHNHGGVTGGVSLNTGGGDNTAGILDTKHTHSVSTQAAATITGTSASGDNVPAFLEVRLYQKD